MDPSIFKILLSYKSNFPLDSHNLTQLNDHMLPTSFREVEKINIFELEESRLLIGGKPLSQACRKHVLTNCHLRRESFGRRWLGGPSKLLL